MRCERFLGVVSLLLASFATDASFAAPPSAGPAARLSAAIGGILDIDLGEAGALAHDLDYSSIRLMPGRGIEYRRRVALEMQRDAQSTAASRLTAARQ